MVGVRIGLALLLLLAPASVMAETVLIEAGRDTTLIEDPDGAPGEPMLLCSEIDEPTSSAEVDARAYIDDANEAAFMIVAYHMNEAMAKQLPAIVHVDGTIRPQTVVRETNPLYHEMISNVGKRTGHPVIMNTSFNVRSEPIICTPLEPLPTTPMRLPERGTSWSQSAEWKSAPSNLSRPSARPSRTPGSRRSRSRRRCPATR